MTSTKFFFKVDSGPLLSEKLNEEFFVSDKNFSFVKIEDNGEAFIPTCLKIVDIKGAPSLFSKGLEDYSEPGYYLVQDGFILCYIKDNSKKNFVHFKPVSTGIKGKYFI